MLEVECTCTAAGLNCSSFNSLGPAAVPLGVPEDALPLHHHHPHPPHPHPVHEAVLAPRPPAGEVTGGGGEPVSGSSALGVEVLWVLSFELFSLEADDTFSCQVRLLSCT